MPVAATEFSAAAGLLGLLAIVALLGVAVLLVGRSRRRGPPSGGPGEAPVLGAAQLHPPDPVADPDRLSVDTLAQQVDAQLVATDNAVRAAPGPIRDAARRELADAYHLRLAWDGDDQRARLREILDHCTAAQDRVGAGPPVSGDVEPLIRTLSRRRAELKARLPSAAVAEKKLSERYADSALIAVRGNVAEATNRLDLAGQQLSQASALLTERDPAAGEAVRAAELTLAQVRTLVDAINTAGTELDAAQAAATSLLTQAHTDIDARRAAQPRRGDQTFADVEQVLAEVQADLASPRPDPLDAIRRAEATLTPLAESLDEPARTQHALSTLDQTLFVVRSYVDAIDDFVATRPEAVGADARTRLAEAQRCLDRAVATASSDPLAAVRSTRSAHAHAERAILAAREDTAD